MTITTEDLFGKVFAEKVDEAGTMLTGGVFGVYSDSACINLITTITPATAWLQTVILMQTKHPIDIILTALF